MVGYGWFYLLSYQPHKMSATGPKKISFLSNKKVEVQSINNHDNKLNKSNSTQ